MFVCDECRDADGVHHRAAGQQGNLRGLLFAARMLVASFVFPTLANESSLFQV